MFESHWGHILLPFVTVNMLRFFFLLLLLLLKAKLVAHLFLILLVSTYPLGLSETILLLYILISRSVPQPDVFHLSMQSVGASTSLTKIVFCSLMSVSFLNRNNFSLFLYHLFVFNCILLCFILLLMLVLACN
jgi:hypothetical protein